jgi:hypothetical protein
MKCGRNRAFTVFEILFSMSIFVLALQAAMKFLIPIETKHVADDNAIALAADFENCVENIDKIPDGGNAITVNCLTYGNGETFKVKKQLANPPWIPSGSKLGCYVITISDHPARRGSTSIKYLAYTP